MLVHFPPLKAIGGDEVTKQFAALLLMLVTASCGGGANDNEAADAAVVNNSALAPIDAPPDVVATAPAPAAALALNTEGLQAVVGESGRTSMIPFGQPIAEVIAAVSRITGERPSADAVNSECGAGPIRIVEFGEGLTLLAQEDRFAGWQSDRAGHTTIDGIGVGTPRAELNESQPKVEPSTLGTEWRIGEGEKALGGLLSDETSNGRVSAIWAGLTCHFR